MASDLLLLFRFAAMVVITTTKKVKVSAITNEEETVNTEIKVTKPNIADLKYGLREPQFLALFTYATNFLEVFRQQQTSLHFQ